MVTALNNISINFASAWYDVSTQLHSGSFSKELLLHFFVIVGMLPLHGTRL